MENIEDLAKFTVPQLKSYLEQRGQSTEGLKKDLFERAVSVWKTENSDTTTEKTPAEVSAGDSKAAVTTATTQAPVSQPSAQSPPTTASGNGIAGANGGQTSGHGQQPKDEDYCRSDYEVDAHKRWVERVRAIEERDKLQALQEDLEEQSWRMRRDEEDCGRDEEKRQRSERTTYLRIFLLHQSLTDC